MKKACRFGSAKWFWLSIFAQFPDVGMGGIEKKKKKKN